eukprot:1184184-Prorocentrum_minimum.AAC.2
MRVPVDGPPSGHHLPVGDPHVVERVARAPVRQQRNLEGVVLYLQRYASYILAALLRFPLIRIRTFRGWFTGVSVPKLGRLVQTRNVKTVCSARESKRTGRFDALEGCVVKS